MVQWDWELVPLKQAPLKLALRLGQEYLVALEWEDLTELQEWEMELVAA
jgi:hypothetical protein